MLVLIGSDADAVELVAVMVPGKVVQLDCVKLVADWILYTRFESALQVNVNEPAA